MRAESSILELVETANGVAIAAPVREIENSSCRSHLRSVVAASLPPARPPVHEKAVWSQAAMASEA